MFHQKAALETFIQGLSTFQQNEGIRPSIIQGEVQNHCQAKSQTTQNTIPAENIKWVR